jgi:hypothetical protein
MSSEFGRFLNSDKHTHFGKFSMINKLDSAVSRKVFSMLLPLNNLVILRHRNWQVWNRSEFTVIKPQSIWANDDIYIIYIYVYILGKLTLMVIFPQGPRKSLTVTEKTFAINASWSIENAGIAQDRIIHTLM